MAMKHHFFNILFIILLLPYPARAAEGLAPVNFKGIYEFSFAGLPFGRMGVEIGQSQGHYAITTDVTLTGLIRLFVQHTSHTTVEAEGGNIHYEAHYQTRKKKHYIRLDYKGGLLKDEEQIPPETHAKRPEVPMEMKKNAADPLSAILKMRQGLWGEMKNLAAQNEKCSPTLPPPQAGEVIATTPPACGGRKRGEPNADSAFSINIYDGNRLTGASFTILGKTTVRYGDKSLPVIKVAVRRKLLAGFTDSELADYDAKEPPLTLYFSDDDRLLPIKAETTFLLSPLRATLAKECRTEESCLLGLRE